MAELAALSLTASGGRRRESEMAQRSKSLATSRSDKRFWAPQGSRGSAADNRNKVKICGYGGIGRRARFRYYCVRGSFRPLLFSPKNRIKSRGFTIFDLDSCLFKNLKKTLISNGFLTNRFGSKIFERI